MNALRIFRVDEKYVRFLRTRDERVQWNKESRRPYVGVVLTVGSYRYFVPMESPKPNHAKLRPAVYILPIEKGQYGLLGFNNMIPVPAAALIPFNFSDEPDVQYAELLRRQASFLNRHKSDVFDRASRTYFLATTNNSDSFFRKVCCDFKKLEAACDRYDPSYKPRRK